MGLIRCSLHFRFEAYWWACLLGFSPTSYVHTLHMIIYIIHAYIYRTCLFIYSYTPTLMFISVLQSKPRWLKYISIFENSVILLCVYAYIHVIVNKWMNVDLPLQHSSFNSVTFAQHIRLKLQFNARIDI